MRKPNVKSFWGINPLFQKYLPPRLVREYGGNETGSMTIFSIFLILAMLIIGGLGVDFMRFEAQRTKLQNTLDRAILASASLNQELDPEAVVRDYFEKAGLSHALISVTVDDGAATRRVEATAGLIMQTTLLKFLNITELSVPAAGVAEEGIGKIEIALVLDVSGSMVSSRGDVFDPISGANQNRLFFLKRAAKQFVDDVMLEDNFGNMVSISIIPYSTQVNAGGALLSKYSVTSEHDNSHCVNFASSDFNSATLSTGALLKRTGEINPWSRVRYVDDPTHWTGYVCPPVSHREILPFSGNPVELKAYIDNMQGSGNTSTDIGIKWGATLLHPNSGPVVSDLITDGVIDPAFAGHPTAFTERGVTKIMIVMTDGANTSQYYFKDAYRDGFSNVFYDPDSDSYSIYDVSKDKYYHAKTDSYTHDSSRWDIVPYHTPSGADVVRLTYPALWYHMSLKWNARYNYRAKESSGTAGNAAEDAWEYDDTVSRHTGGTKDGRMSNMCTAIKAASREGLDPADADSLMLFTIGFNVTATNATKLSNCATKPEFYYGVTSGGIGDAFSSIATFVTSLRLVN